MAIFDGIGAHVYDDEERIFWTDHGEVNKGWSAYWMASPLSGADDSDIDKLDTLLKSNLPAGSVRQFGILSYQNVDQAVSLYLSGKENDGIAGKLARQHAQLFVEGTKNPRAMIPGVENYVKSRVVIISLRIPAPSLENGLAKREAITAISDTESQLESIFPACQRMTEYEYLAFMRLLHHIIDGRLDGQLIEDQTLSEQIFYPGDAITYADDHIRFHTGDSADKEEAEYNAMALSMKFYPEMMSLPIMSSLLGHYKGINSQVSGSSWMVTSIYYPDPATEMAALEKKSIMIKNQAFGPIRRAVPIIAKKADNFQLLIDDMTGGEGGFPVKVNTTIWMFGRDKAALSRQLNTAKTHYATEGFDVRADRYILEALWKLCLPGGWFDEGARFLFRYHTMSSASAAHLLPVIAELDGTGLKGGVLLASRRNTPFLLDLWDSSTNANGLIFAESRSGKSVFLQQLVVDYLAQGCRAFVIDVGRSQKKLATLFGKRAQYIELSDTSRICLNPFSQVTDLSKSIQGIQGVIAKMAFASGKLPDYAAPAIEEAIKSCWEAKGTDSTVTDVAEVLLNSQDKRIQDIGKQLYPFTREGMYGHWFDGYCDLNLEADYVVLELEDIKSSKHLRDVVLVQVFNTIMQSIYLDRSGRKSLVMIDEAKDMICDPVIGRIIDLAYRQIAKYGGGGAILSVLQSILHLEESDVGASILQSAAWQFILKQKDEVISLANKQGFMALSEYEKQLLSSVHVSKGNYSEIMLRGTDGTYGVFRHILSDYAKLLFFTDGEERVRLLNAIDEGRDIDEVIEEMLIERGKKKPRAA